MKQNDLSPSFHDCQSRGEKTLDFAYNASLAAINVTKVMVKEYELPLSIGRIKSLMVNAHFAKRFLQDAGLTLTQH